MGYFNHGWICLARALLDTDINSCPERLSIWINLLLKATYKETTINWNGSPRRIPPGVAVVGFRSLSERLKIPKTNIRRVFEYLEKRTSISVESGPRGTLVTICNWEQYQITDKTVDRSKTEKWTGDGPQMDPYRESTTNKEEEEESHQQANDPPLSQAKSANGEPKKPASRKVHQHPLAEIWNQHCSPLPPIRGCDSTRVRKAEALWRQNPDPEYWIEVIQKMRSAPFCTGDNPRGWRADFNFFLKPDTHFKVLEGKYSALSNGSINTTPLKLEI